MRKIFLIPGIILVLILFSIFIVKQNYKGSPDYNYVTAKLDIAKGKARIVNTGYRVPCSQDKQIDSLTAAYGFEQVYIGYDSTKQLMKGIHNYNELIDAYLMIRNGNNWRAEYQAYIDSLKAIP